MPATRPQRSLVRRLMPLIGIALLVWVLSRLDSAALLTAAARIRSSWLVGSCALFSVNMGLKALRWQRMLAWQGIALSWPVSIAAFFSGQFYGQVTVGRVGELMRAEALTAIGVSTGRALSACLVDRVLDLALVASTATILSALLLTDARGAVVASVVLLGATVAGLLALQALARAHRQGRLGGPLRGATAVRGLDFLVDLLDGAAPLLRPLALFESLAWTGTAWLFYYAALWLLAAGLGADASLTLLTAASALSGLSTLLPISISGLGAREAIFAEMMQTQGVPSEISVILALLNLAVMMSTSLVLGGVGVLARQRQLSRIEAPLGS